MIISVDISKEDLFYMEKLAKKYRKTRYYIFKDFLRKKIKEVRQLEPLA